MEDDLFRLVLVGLAVIFMPLGLYHRFRSYTGETIDRWQEGVLILFGLRLTALVVLGTAVIWMINPAWLAWSALPLPTWLRWVGVVGASCGGILFVWAVHTLGKNLTDTVVTRKDHSLVVTGPYRWVRHPFYTACLLGLVGTVLVMANWFLLLMGSIGFGFIIARTRIEEKKLVECFGEEYRKYMARTWWFFPHSRS